MLDIVVFERRHEDIAAQAAQKLLSGSLVYPSGIIISPRYPKIGGRFPELVVISEKASHGLKLPSDIACKTLLLPGSYTAPSIKAANIVSYGMASTDSITLSSVSAGKFIVAVQEDIPSAVGTVIEQQEIPVKKRRRQPPDSILASVGMLLILGIPPEKLDLI